MIWSKIRLIAAPPSGFRNRNKYVKKKFQAHRSSRPHLGLFVDLLPQTDFFLILKI